MVATRFALDTAAGLLIGTVSVLLSISLAALIFTGSLSAHLSTGIFLSLLSAAVIGAVVAATSSYPGTIALPHDRTAPILALMVGHVAALLPAGSPDVLPTVVSAIALSSMITGLALLLLGTLDLGRLIRFIPYPVVGGLLAGTGWLLVVGAIRLMADVDVNAATAGGLFTIGVLDRWGPGAAFAIVLTVAYRRWSHPLVLPGMLLGGIVLCHAVFWAAGVSHAEAQARGWLLGNYAPVGAWWAPGILTSPHTHWAVILGQSTSIAVIALIAAISILLNSSALELGAERDVDLDRELESAGCANLLAGLAGGIVGFHSLSVSSLLLEMGRRSRLVGLVSAATCGFALWYGTRWLALFPKAIAGGLLMSLGLGFLFEWILDARFRLPRSDYAVMLLILAVMGAVGFLEGVAVGIAAAVVLFVLSYSRISVVKQALSGAQYHSNVDRPLAHHRLLREKGDRTHILMLQGFIFFGTAHRLLDQVRSRAFDGGRAPLRFAVLDFRRVTGLDSSALLSFVKLRRLAEQEGFRLVLTQVSRALHHQIAREGFAPGSAVVRVFPDLDRGVEWCEEEILDAERVASSRPSRTLREQLAPFWPSAGSLDRFLGILERRELPEGCCLIRQGAPADELFFVESGQLSARLSLEDGHEVRLRTMGAGAVVGEMGLYLRQTRSASIVTDTPTAVYALSVVKLGSLQRDAPETAAAFHQFVAALLAERLRHANDTLRVLLD